MWLQFEHARAKVKRHSAFFVFGTKQRRNLGIDAGQNFRSHFDNRNFAAKRRKQAGKLHTDDAATHDGDAFGHFGCLQRLATCPKVAKFDSFDGWQSRFGTGANQQSFGLVKLTAAVDFDDFIGIFDRRFALHNRNMLQFGTNAGRQLTHHFCFARTNFGIVERHMFGSDAIFCTRQSLLIEFGTVEQRFGGNAPFVEAHAAERFFFEQHHVQTTLCSTFGCRITGRPTTDDCQIVCHNFH